MTDLTGIKGRNGPHPPEGESLGLGPQSGNPGEDHTPGHARGRVRGDPSEEERDRERRRKRREKHRKRSRSRDRKERKKDKKKDKKKKKTGAVTSQYGKYGIINESEFSILGFCLACNPFDRGSSSLYNKGQEFRAWLIEERKINPETQSKESTRKEFAQFMEDYNTATLPHEKYYNMDVYERRMNALRHGELLPAGDELTYDVNADLKAHSSTHKRRAIERESYLSKEQLMELRKVQNERIEAGKMKLLGMDLPQNLGVRMDGTAFDG
ncbi:hypothetical protein BDM02DRAFT_3186248 [Thelephora ganbajun]|uniref:Uncharacterized protein n=1 Tax=Thelephora ganbajun TaxID=370292 RepID=A0ACB6ZJ63_THEGA|nr:hypothetical protein BDM02DRAFT_3186248 [Thelephora ganbajun]